MSILNYLHSAPWFLPVRVFLSQVYALLVWGRHMLYDLGIFKTHQIKTKVISIGNISAGGSGKTILVQSLVEYFLGRSIRPVVLSRGYGRSSRGVVVAADEKEIKAPVKAIGDEPFLIATNFPGLPVVVAEDRVSGAKYIESRFDCDVILLDDGFQHRRLHRDLDILLLDFPAHETQHLLPWGNLREPLVNRDRADLIVYSKAGVLKDGDSNLVLEPKSYVEDHAGRHRLLTELIGNYGVFAGLGKPEQFFQQIEGLLGPAKVRLVFPDHTEYDPRKTAEIAWQDCDYWITTQKDYIKLDPSFCEGNQIFCMGVHGRMPDTLKDHLKRHFN